MSLDVSIQSVKGTRFLASAIQVVVKVAADTVTEADRIKDAASAENFVVIVLIPSLRERGLDIDWTQLTIHDVSAAVAKGIRTLAPIPAPFNRFPSAAPTVYPSVTSYPTSAPTVLYSPDATAAPSTIEKTTAAKEEDTVGTVTRDIVIVAVVLLFLMFLM